MQLNLLVYILFLFLEKVVPLFPPGLWYFKARVYSYIFYYLIPIRKKTAFQNLKLAFPDMNHAEAAKIVRRVYENVFTVIFEFFMMNKLSKAEFAKHIKIKNPELVGKLLEKGKGLIMISGHFGNWELIAYGIPQINGIPVGVIVKKQTNERVDKRITKIREHGGNTMIEMNHALRETLTLLKENKVVAMLGDQSAPAENSVKVRFFVENVPTFEGAARFAIKTGASVIFSVPFRNNDHTYTIEFQEVDISKYTEYCDENVRALTQEHTALLEEAIRKRPDHWLWFHRRFKHILST